MRSQARGYVRRHGWIVATFFVLSGGTAWATHPGGANTISSEDLIDEEVRTWDIRDNHVRTSDLQAGAVNREKLAKGAVIRRKINNGAVDEAKLADLAVTLPKLADGAVDSAKVVDDSLSGDDIEEPTLVGLWQLGGNSGTTGSDFLGTTDNQPLELRVNGFRALRLEPAEFAGPAPNLIGGNPNNEITPGARAATISGGGIGTLPNRVTDDFGTVGGGLDNQAGGGAVVPFDRRFATVGGGSFNTASGPDATVGGGLANTASGDRATVGGGGDNTAAGDGSFVAGHRAKNVDPLHDGVFLFADRTGFEFHSVAANEFAARATGGFRFVTAVDGTGATTKQCTISPAADMTCDGSFSGTAFNVTSDRAQKTAFAPVEPSEVLERVARLPVSSWRYRGERGVRHIGPTAQAFRRAFGLGSDRRSIATVDADGVALAAIKALERKVDRLRERVRELER